MTLPKQDMKARLQCSEGITRSVVPPDNHGYLRLGVTPGDLQSRDQGFRCASRTNRMMCLARINGTMKVGSRLEGSCSNALIKSGSAMAKGVVVATTNRMSTRPRMLRVKWARFCIDRHYPERERRQRDVAQQPGPANAQGSSRRACSKRK